MTSLLAVFGFLAAVLYEGHSLSCETCLGHGSASCQGSMKKCDKVDDKCIQGYENNTLGSDTRLTVVRACQNTQEMPPFVCEASDHSVRNSEFYLGFVTTCGQDRDELEVPPINLTSNGYKCPDCMKEDTVEECKTEKVIECVGRQTQCFSYRGKTSRPGLDMVSYSCKGCATPHFCSLLHLLPGTRVDFPSSQCNCTPAF